MRDACARQSAKAGDLIAPTPLSGHCSPVPTPVSGKCSPHPRANTCLAVPTPASRARFLCSNVNPQALLTLDRQLWQHQTRHAVHSHHNSQQSSAALQSSLPCIKLAASGDVCSRHVYALRARPGAQSVASTWRLGPHGSLRGVRHPASVSPEGQAPLGPRLIVGGDWSGNELTSN